MAPWPDPSPPPEGALPERRPVDQRADVAACRAALAHGSKTFLAASLLLPRGVCEPAAVLYAFCRLADDAVDGQGEAAGRSLGAVERLRARLRAAYAGRPHDEPADRALARVVRRHGVPAALFDALLEGFEWDRDGRQYETLDELCEYAARVAGTVGAMMALLMGERSVAGLARACDLGVAMQLSNIARDVGEDARMGRLYLPRAWLREAGLDPEAWLRAPRPSAALAAVVQRVLAAADALYGRVGDGVAGLPFACRPGINAARFLYAEIGHEVARRGGDSVSARARVGMPRKLALLLRAAGCAVLPRRATPRPAPALPACCFLIDAARAARPAPVPARVRRGLHQQLLGVLELFARLEQRDRALRP